MTGIGATMEVCAGTVVSCAPVLPRFFQQHGHQLSGLFHLPRVPGITKGSRHFRLSSASAPNGSHKNPSQISPLRISKHRGAREERTYSQDPFSNTED
ncbi:MAG: hypothetical protein L6R37_007771, partial [Teloschistes peruensis]